MWIHLCKAARTLPKNKLNLKFPKTLVLSFWKLEIWILPKIPSWCELPRISRKFPFSWGGRSTRERQILIYHNRQWSVIITLLEARDIIQINNRADSHIWNRNTGKEKTLAVFFYCFVFFNQFQHWQVLQPVQFEKRRGICCLQFIFDQYFGDRTSFQVSSQLHQLVVHLEIDKIYLQRMKNWHLHNLEVLICPIVRRLSRPPEQNAFASTLSTQLELQHNFIYKCSL